MDENPYQSPAPVDEPPRRASIRTAAKRGAKIGAIIVSILFVVGMVFVAVGQFVRVIPADDELGLLPALTGGVVWSLLGAALGAGCGALFQAFSNAIFGKGRSNS